MIEFGSNPRAVGAARQFAYRAAIALLIAVLIIGLTVFVGVSIETWFAVYLGILLAIFIRTLSGWVHRYTRLPEKGSVVAVIAALIGLAALAGWSLARPISQETRQLQQQLPKAIDRLQEKINSTGINDYVPDAASNSSKIAAAGGQVATTAINMFSGTLRSIVTIFVVIFLGMYLAFSPQDYVDGFIALFPIPRRAQARDILRETGVKLRHWIFGQIVSMVAVGGMIALGLYVSGVPVPLVLGFIAGLLDIIPIFGPIIAAVPAMLLAFTVGPWHPLYVVIVFVAANQIEQHLLIPIVQRYSISLPPALTVVALLLMGSLFGFWGILLAAPVTATIIVLVKRIYVEAVLGDKQPSK